MTTDVTYPSRDHQVGIVVGYSVVGFTNHVEIGWAVDTVRTHQATIGLATARARETPTVDTAYLAPNHKLEPVAEEGFSMAPVKRASGVERGIDGQARRHRSHRVVIRIVRLPGTHHAVRRKPGSPAGGTSRSWSRNPMRQPGRSAERNSVVAPRSTNAQGVAEVRCAAPETANASDTEHGRAIAPHTKPSTKQCAGHECGCGAVVYAERPHARPRSACGLTCTVCRFTRAGCGSGLPGLPRRPSRRAG